MATKQAYATVSEEFVNPMHHTPTNIDIEVKIDGLGVIDQAKGKFMLFNVPIRHLDEVALAKVLGVDGMDPADVAFIDKVLSLHHKHQIMKVLADRMS